MRPARLGFSLIELLAVVGVISLLLGLLFPALRSARGQARQLGCLVNTKGIATASHIYALEDQNEWIIPYHPRITHALPARGNYEWGGKSGLGGPLEDPTDSLTSIWGTADGRGPGTRPLNRIIYRTVLADYELKPGSDQHNWLSDTRLDLLRFRCPSDLGFTGLHFETWEQSGLTSFDHFGNSYVANTFMIAVPEDEECYLSLGPFLRSMSSIPQASATYTYLENAGRFAWYRVYDAATCYSPKLVTAQIGAKASRDERPPRAWHGGATGFNVAFADGHAEGVDITGRIIPAPELPAYPDLPIASASAEPVGYQSYRCLIIRGADWNKDCLPAPPVAWFACRK